MKRSTLGILALAAAGGAMALAPAAAQATTVDQALGKLAVANGTVGSVAGYDFNDEDTATLYRQTGVTDQHLTQGDVLVGSFKFTSLSSGANAVGLGDGVSLSLGNANEVTGIYAIQVASVTQNGSNWDVQFKAVDTSGGPTSYTNALNPLDQRDFDSFFTEGATTLSSDTMFKLYQDDSNDSSTSLDGGGFDNPAASNGDLYAAAGVVDAVDTYTITFADAKVGDGTGILLSRIASTPDTDRVNQGSTVRLSITDDGTTDDEGIGDYALGDYYFPGATATTGDPYQVTGQVDIFSGGFGSFTSKDSFSFQLTVVPVPASVWTGLALMGLLGAGMVIRRRRQAA